MRETCIAKNSANKSSCSTQGMIVVEHDTVAGSDNTTESLTESSRLTQLEETIKSEQRSDAHLAIGKALWEIRDARLYKEAGYRNFANYAKTRWNYSRRQADRLIKFAKE